jgi:hypothetical protein
MSIEESIARLEELIVTVRDMRAERWLREWPDGNAERPHLIPDCVKSYLGRQPQSSNAT